MAFESVSQANDTNRQGDLLHHQPVRIIPTVAALMMGADDFRNARPGELNPADESDVQPPCGPPSRGILQRREMWASEQTLVYRDFAMSCR